MNDNGNPRVALINALYRESSYLIEARRQLAEAEEALLRGKLALSDAEEALDRTRAVFMATAPEAAKNEVQRRYYADTQTGEAAENVGYLRREVVEREIVALWARMRVRSAEDSRRFTEGLLVIPSLADDAHVPGTLRLPPLPGLPDVSGAAAERLAAAAS